MNIHTAIEPTCSRRTKSRLVSMKPLRWAGGDSLSNQGTMTNASNGKKSKHLIDSTSGATDLLGASKLLTAQHSNCKPNAYLLSKIVPNEVSAKSTYNMMMRA